VRDTALCILLHGARRRTWNNAERAPWLSSALFRDGGRGNPSANVVDAHLKSNLLRGIDRRGSMGKHRKAESDVDSDTTGSHAGNGDDDTHDGTYVGAAGPDDAIDAGETGAEARSRQS